MDNTWLVVFLAISFQSYYVLTFNLDLGEPIVMYGVPGEYFGFTVALHSHRSDKWILVGAPLANQTAPPGSRYKIHERYGSVYKCRPQTGSACEAVPIDTTDPNYQMHDDQPVDTEEKTGQWLGATLHSTGKDGHVVACAPRYSLRGKFFKNPKDRARRMLGRCFLVHDNLGGQYQQIDPCYHGEDARELMYGYGQDGLCQAGFGASLTKDDSTLALSAVGILYGKGSIGAYFKDSKETIFVQNADLKMDYWGDAMGYAVTTGHFKSSNKEQIVGSSPRAGDLNGRVMAFDVIGQEQIKVSFTLPLPKDTKMGSYFGHTVCTVDLNNDGMSDLLVGAPRYSYDKDEGRVYVYVNNGLGALNLMDNMMLDGDRQVNAHFGFAVASVGDLNKDGFNDVAIGAPYGGEDGRGVVYLYHGNSKGIDTKYRQKVTASMLGDKKIKTFGYSLSGGLDVDDNNYPDVAVGAFSSDRAVLLRTRPIVEVDGKIELSESQIILEDNRTSMCDFTDGTRHKCLTAKVCLKYSHKVPTNQGVDLAFSLELDQDMQSDFLRRIFFLGRNETERLFSVSSTMSLSKQNQWTCAPAYQVYLREEKLIGNVLSSLTFDLKFDLKKSASCSVCPILDDYDNDRRRTVRAETLFQKQCGKDQECVPDMTVSGTVSYAGGYKDLRIGVSNEMFVSITVGNKADDFAYPGKVIVTYPSLLGYIGVGAKQGVQCNRIDSGKDVQKAVCMVGMPFKGKTKKTFDLRFTTSEIKGNISQFYINLFATSPSRDANLSDNTAKLLVNVKFEADLSITGSSLPDEVVYENNVVPFFSIKTEKDIGPLILQNIIVRNDGPSTVDGSLVTISVPWKHSANKHSYLLYLLNVRVRGSFASCDVITNPLNIKMDNSTKNRQHIPEPGSAALPKEQRNVKEDKGISCNSVECLTFKCRLGRLQKGDDVEILMTSRLWQNTLTEADLGAIDIVTKATITPPSSITEPLDDKSNEVTLFVRANPRQTKTPPETTPVWIIIVAILAGLILLGILIYVLYRCGFFKRKRAKDFANEEEKMTSSTKYDEAPQ